MPLRAVRRQLAHGARQSRPTSGYRTTNKVVNRTPLPANARQRTPSEPGTPAVIHVYLTSKGQSTHSASFTHIKGHSARDWSCAAGLAIVMPIWRNTIVRLTSVVNCILGGRRISTAGSACGGQGAQVDLAGDTVGEIRGRAWTAVFADGLKGRLYCWRRTLPLGTFVE